MRDEELVREAKRLIDAIAAKPRFAGSAEESEARRFCAAELRKAGIVAAEKEFEFSEWPGRWGIPLIAGGILFLVVIAAAAAEDKGPSGLVLLLVAFVFLLGNRVLHSRRDTATQRMRSLRSKSINLESTRGNEPRVWLVAHIDSKSQSIPMLVRVASHATLLAVLAAEAVAAFSMQWGFVHPAHWGWMAAVGAIAAAPSLFCFVGNKSRGALDNATGVASVLLAARLISPEKPLGVLITSGEELDLAGARAWGKDAVGAPMINCDTVDDAGDWRCMYGNRPHAICIAAERAAKKLGLPLRMGRVIPGIITDSLAFETAGLPSVTLSRGTLRTLARLHTRGDNPDHISGAGAATAARLLAGMVEELS
jgi:hypothetical protein